MNLPKAKWLLSICCALLLVNGPLQAAGTGILRGTVTDSATGEALAYANVHIMESSLGAMTNARGYYIIAAAPTGTHIVVFSYLGYRTQRLSVTISEEHITQSNVRLVPSEIELEELIVFGDKSVRPNEAGLGVQMITPREIEARPPGIEADIFRVLQTQPGVGSSGDITSTYYVRGGASDQNLVLLNGATVYNPFHTLGIFSVIDPKTVSVMEFYSGGFPPTYGGRLSSILNVVTRDGNKNAYRASARASLLSGEALVEGPIPNGSVLMSGRKSYYGKILKRYLQGQEVPFDFYDLSFKVNYSNPHIDENGTFVIHGFLSEDDVRNNDPLKEDYGIRNSIVGTNWHRIWAAPLYSDMSLSYSSFNADVRPNLSRSKQRNNTVDDVSFHWDFTYNYESHDELAFGVETKYLRTQLMLDNLYGKHFAFNENGFDLSGYVDYRFFRWESFGLNIGLRPKLSALSKLRPFLFEPRVSSTYKPNPSVVVKAAVGVYSQELTTLSDEHELISIFQPWIIIPDYLASSQTIHVTAGVTTYPTDALTVDVEGYYKSMTDLIDVNLRKFSPKDRDFINVNGRSYGTDFLLKIHTGSAFIQTGYSLGWAFRTNGDEQVVPRYDIRHSLNLLLGMDLGAGVKANLMWSLKSGYPFTPIAGFYDKLSIPVDAPYSIGNDYVPATLWGQKNSARLPVYHRLDVSASKKTRWGPADISAGLSIINVYDRKNIFYFNRDTGERIYMMRFSPSVFVEIEL